MRLDVFLNLSTKLILLGSLSRISLSKLNDVQACLINHICFIFLVRLYGSHRLKRRSSLARTDLLWRQGMGRPYEASLLPKSLPFG